MGDTNIIVEDIRPNQLRWYCHVQHMWTPTGRRKRGRPRRSWAEGIREQIRERGLNEDQWINREEWRNGIGKHRRTL